MQPRLEGNAEPLRGILSPPISTLSPAISGFSGQSGASCGVLWSRVGLGRHSGCYIGVYSTYLDSYSWPLKHCLATPVDAEYIALRVILNINKMLVNLQRVLIKSLHNL